MTRLQKLLAAAGDDVRLDGRKLDLKSAQLPARELLLYYKPVGEVTTRNDPQGRPTVFERPAAASSDPPAARGCAARRWAGALRSHHRENADGDAAAGSHSHFRVVLHEGRNREVRPPAERGGVRGQPSA